jgi:hypothetical protein
VDVNLLVDGSVTKLRVCQDSRVDDSIGNSTVAELGEPGWTPVSSQNPGGQAG